MFDDMFERVRWWFRSSSPTASMPRVKAIYAYNEGDEASDGYHASATGIGVWPPTVAERNAAG
jgi:hypothetical protein